MRLTRIGLTDFKRHERLDIEPAAGLTIVRGPNESGKSTIHEALRMVLYRKADSNREDVRSAQRWGTSAPPEVVIEFEADGQQGRLIKRFAGPKGDAELTIDGQAIRDFGLIQEHISAMTGIPTESFFRATASVGHAELSEVAEPDEPAISDRLQKAVSGADRGTATAKRKLDAAIHRYRTEGHKNPGLVKAVREEITTLEAELARGEQALARLEADRAQWAEAHERRAALDVEQTRQQVDLGEARRAETLVVQRDEAQARYVRLKRATELVEEADRLQRELPRDLPLSSLRSAVSRAITLRFELSEVEADLGVDAEASVADEPEVKPPHPVRWLALAVGLVAAGWLAWTLLSGALGGIAVVGFTLAAFVALGQTLRLASRRRQHGLAVQLAAGAAARRQEADNEQQERFRRKRRELEAVLATLGMSDVESAEALLATAEQQTDELAHIEGELRGMGVQDRNARRLEEDRDEAANATEQARHALAGMGELAGDPGARRPTLQRLAEQTTLARDKARSEEDQAQGRVDANMVDAEVVAGVAERCAMARTREAELLRRVRIYEDTRQAIEAAEQATLKTAARYLEEHMGPAVARITDGRYDEITVDERSLAFKVRAPETGELVAVEQLSQGTADQLFLAARLGLVRLVTMDRRPPLILDDPFVTFDPDRAERAIGVLKEAAAEQGFQVILLTCSDRFDGLADQLVVLDAPAAIPEAGVAA
ncbi:MAG TPA: AAA family ATPase [Candidatus Limnocylindrales bacterium]|nr:AAA family ATPase [Candidatus Limnocylindrales bacterium]